MYFHSRASKFLIEIANDFLMVLRKIITSSDNVMLLTLYIIVMKRLCQGQIRHLRYQKDGCSFQALEVAERSSTRDGERFQSVLFRHCHQSVVAGGDFRTKKGQIRKVGQYRSNSARSQIYHIDCNSPVVSMKLIFISN